MPVKKTPTGTHWNFRFRKRDDPMEPNRKELGKTKTSIAQSIQNCSSAASCTTIPAKLKDATITIDDSGSSGKGKGQTEGVLGHEVSHANDAVTDPQGTWMRMLARRTNSTMIDPKKNAPISSQTTYGRK
jgi:hypothetical protein